MVMLSFKFRAIKTIPSNPFANLRSKIQRQQNTSIYHTNLSKIYQLEVRVLYFYPALTVFYDSHYWCKQ